MTGDDQADELRRVPIAGWWGVVNDQLTRRAGFQAKTASGAIANRVCRAV